MPGDHDLIEKYFRLRKCFLISYLCETIYECLKLLWAVVNIEQNFEQDKVLQKEWIWTLELTLEYLFRILKAWNKIQNYFTGKCINSQWSILLQLWHRDLLLCPWIWNDKCCMCLIIFTGHHVFKGDKKERREREGEIWGGNSLTWQDVVEGYHE